jgi:hypothetical protein
MRWYFDLRRQAAGLAEPAIALVIVDSGVAELALCAFMRALLLRSSTWTSSKSASERDPPELGVAQHRRAHQMLHPITRSSQDAGAGPGVGVGAGAGPGHVSVTFVPPTADWLFPCCVLAS